MICPNNRQVKAFVVLYPLCPLSFCIVEGLVGGSNQVLRGFLQGRHDGSNANANGNLAFA